MAQRSIKHLINKIDANYLASAVVGASQKATAAVPDRCHEGTDFWSGHQYRLDNLFQMRVLSGCVFDVSLVSAPLYWGIERYRPVETARVPENCRPTEQVKTPHPRGRVDPEAATSYITELPRWLVH